jgi:hypothetical protein
MTQVPIDIGDESFLPRRSQRAEKQEGKREEKETRERADRVVLPGKTTRNKSLAPGAIAA